RESLLRAITTRVHSSADADTIMRTAVRELSNALGREAYIEVGNKDKTTLPESPSAPAPVAQKPITLSPPTRTRSETVPISQPINNNDDEETSDKETHE
ncbi:MAG: hypothetical protein N2D54_06545, partial [Chloroflexota bacterium]